MNLKKINNFFLFLILCFTSISCIIEIPLKSIEVKDVIKYNDIKIKKEEDSKDNFNQISFIDEGSTKISPSRLFLATIKISSSEQSFNLVLDTGSPYLWVAKLGSKNKAEKKTISNYFEPTSNSVNTNSPFKMEYGTGSCSGTYYKDTIKYINNKKFQFKFGVATETDFTVENADGIIGLSHYYSDKSTSFIHRLYEEGITNSKKFSFKFGDNISSGQMGKLFLGKHDDFSSSDTVKCPLINYKTSLNIFWSCNLSKFGLKNSKYEINSSQKFNVIFDTGTNVIILPLEYLKEIEGELKNFECEKYQDDKKNYQLICKKSNSLPDFRFEINGNILTVPHQYSFYSVNQYSYSRIIFKKYDYYIIGSPFFFAFHTLFDEEEGNLYFHPENIKYLEIGNGNSTFTAADLAAIIVVIIVILGLAYIIYYFIKWKRAKNALEEAFPRSDYVFYNN